jgi:hypothetical protein
MILCPKVLCILKILLKISILRFVYLNNESGSGFLHDLHKVFWHSFLNKNTRICIRHIICIMRIQIQHKNWRIQILVTKYIYGSDRFGYRLLMFMLIKEKGGLILELEQKYPWGLLPTFQKSQKITKKCFDPVTASSLVKTFWVMHYIRVKKNFFTIWTSWVSKDAEFYIDFKHINLP